MRRVRFQVGDDGKINAEWESIAEYYYDKGDPQLLNNAPYVNTSNSARDLQTAIYDSSKSITVHR